jgi:hypothetical protein
MALPEYENALSQGYEFLDNHNQLLHSLKISKLHADNRTYTERTQGIGNGPIESGEGVSEAGDGSVA